MSQIDLKELTQNINRIAAHWITVDSAFPTRPLTLASSSATPGGMDHAGLVALGNAISADFAGVVAADNVTQEVQSRRNTARKTLLPSVKLFRKSVQAYLPESAYVGQLPDAPSVAANDRLFEDAAEDVLNIWAKIDADKTLKVALPFTLSDGTNRVEFQKKLQSVKMENAALPAAKENARRVRATRDGNVRLATAALRTYRRTAAAHLPPGHPLLATLPALAR